MLWSTNHILQVRSKEATYEIVNYLINELQSIVADDLKENIQLPKIMSTLVCGGHCSIAVKQWAEVW